MDTHDKRLDGTGRGNGAPMMRLAGVEDDSHDALADLFLGDSELAPPAYSNTGTDDPSGPTAVPVVHAAAPGVRTADAAPRVPVQVIAREDERDEPIEDDQRGVGSLPTVEAVLLGHLPVRASLWVRQYACSVARRRSETIALVRAVAGSTSIDLITGTEPMQSVEMRSLHDAMRLVNERADRVILRVDETTEPELLERDEIDEVTILTGADEAAIVASYRLIKTITGVWEADAVIGVPHLRLAVMGATGQQVAQASAKLTRAVDAFLDRPIEIIDAAGRIDATGTANIYRDSTAHRASEIIDTLVETGCGIPEEDVGGDVGAVVDEVSSPGGAVHASPETAAPGVPVRAAPRPSMGLSELIEGLTRLDTRCPHAPGVEIACDPSGRIHLVCDDAAGAVGRLESARAWVRDHLDLLLRAETLVRIPDAMDRGELTTAHVLAHEPRSMRGLIDSDIRLYALARVEIGDRIAMVATPIN